MVLTILLVCLSQASASAQSASHWSCAENAGPCRAVFIVHNSWHAAIVLAKSDLAEIAMPELVDFPTARFIEFGWGDKDYFPDPQSGVLTAIKAALWSSGSVIHLVGLSDSVENFYRGASITELRLSETAYRRLADYLDKTFARDRSLGRARAAPGLFSYSYFYPANGKFSLLRTCNSWVAEALEQAGLPISATWVITAGSLQSQLSGAMETP